MGHPEPPPSPRARMQDAVAKVMQKVADDKAKARAHAQAERLKRQRRKRLGSLLVITAAVAFGISLRAAIPAGVTRCGRPRAWPLSATPGRQSHSRPRWWSTIGR